MTRRPMLSTPVRPLHAIVRELRLSNATNSTRAGVARWTFVGVTRCGVRGPECSAAGGMLSSLTVTP